MRARDFLKSGAVLAAVPPILLAVPTLFPLVSRRFGRDIGAATGVIGPNLLGFLMGRAGSFGTLAMAGVAALPLLVALASESGA